MFDRLRRDLRKRVAKMSESGMGYWILRVKLRDGRRYRNVILNSSFKCDSSHTPFHLRDVVDVRWDGYPRSGQTSSDPIPLAPDEPFELPLDHPQRGRYRDQ